MNEIEEKLKDMPADWLLLVSNHLKNVYENGRKQGIDEAIDKLTELHGKALARHNYYANAAIEVRRLRKK